jgi:hypothetical protein
MRFVPHRNHVEFLRRGDQFGDQHFEGVALVGGGEEWAEIRFPDEAEEFYPGAWEDQPEEFAVGAGYLVLVDCALLREFVSNWLLLLLL